jgi:glucose/arabinose dehydrogenase
MAPVSVVPRLRRSRHLRPAILGIALVLALTGCGPSRGSLQPPRSASPTAAASPTAPPASTPASAGLSPRASGSGVAFDPSRVSVALEPFVDGLTAPLAIVNAADGTDRLFVAEQEGRIRIVRDGALVAAPMLDLSDRISSGGERGLLGLAFHPGYPGDPRAFVDYTDRDGNTVVSSFRVDPANPDRLDPASEAILLHVQQPFPNHNGGGLVFTADDLLLISLGDGGSGGDPLGNGQSTTTLLGKILRIDVDRPAGDRPYGIPPSNPFPDGAAGRPEIWLTGLRNPWRLSVDRANGDVWIGDVGQGDWEEVDVQRAAAPGGTNFGWNRMEGRHCFQPPQGCEDPALTLPITDYGHDQGCTVIGGYVDRAATASALSGGYLFGDYCSGRLWAIDPAVDGPRDPVVVGESGVSLSAFGEDESGDLYAADISGGAILRVVATAR